MPPADLKGFPAKTHPEGSRFWRAARQAPWWFCCCGGCRFDLRDPRGTCYMGTDELSGVIESIGIEIESGVVSSEYLDARRLFTIRLSSPMRVADLVSRAAIGRGVTNELSTMVPYEIPQAWAEKFDNVGLEGIRYRTRFDTGAAPKGLAQFGPKGTGTTAPGRGRRIDASLRQSLEVQCGVKVLPAPSFGELEIAEDP